MVNELPPDVLEAYGNYVRQHMEPLVTGENHFSDGLLWDRLTGNES